MKISVLLSGGVDSSVALALLKEQGYDITAYYLKIWLEDELSFLGECPWEDDLNNTRAVCEKFNVPLEILNLQKEYLDTVVEYTIKELKAGRTPSPDIFCNKQVKFGAFLKYTTHLYDKVATGHYAKIEEQIVANKDNDYQSRENQTIYLLKQAPDPVKDQTYFLTYLNQDQLSKIWFPLGNFNKREVRQLAEKFDLPNKNRPDSQGICFLGKIKFSDFVKFHLGEKIGKIIDIDSQKVLGEHKGYWFHTIGQRQGLGLSGGPWYVVQKDITNNIIYVSHSNNIIEKHRNELIVADVNWIYEVPTDGTNLKVKLRHGPKMSDCEVFHLSDGRLDIKMQEYDQGIARGQFAILYKDDYCLGGGIIDY